MERPKYTYIHLWMKYRNGLGWAGMIHGAILEWRHRNKVCRSWNGLFRQLSKTWGANDKLCICNQIHDQDSTLFRAVSTMHATFATGNKPLAGIDISDLTFVFLQKQGQSIRTNLWSYRTDIPWNVSPPGCNTLVQIPFSAVLVCSGKKCYTFWFQGNT